METKGFWRGVRDAFSGARLTPQTVVQVHTGIAPQDVGDRVAHFTDDPCYVKHTIIPQSDGLVTIQVEMRPAMVGTMRAQVGGSGTGSQTERS